MKTIAICGSMKFYQQFTNAANQLTELGYKTLTPNPEGTDTDYASMSQEEQASIKNAFIDKHIEKIRQSDAILVINPPKNNIDHYIGANTFLEMGFAFILKKPILILHNIPNQPNHLELTALKPKLLNGNLHKITKYL